MKFRLLEKPKQWLRKHWIILGSLTLAAGILAGIAIYMHDPDAAGVQRLERNTTTQKEQPLEPPKQPVPLTGIKVEPEAAKRPVTSVMIENSPAARPQSSLDSAGIVFEAVVEGDITRFLALYQNRTPKKVGPIRSLRPYFLDWAMGFDAPIAHVGGSAKALRLVKKRGAKDLDQFKHNGPYYRDTSRYAPHNMYASMKDLRGLQKRLGYNKTAFKPIPRSEDDPAKKPGATKITLNYSDSQYRAQFRYRKKSNTYRRYLAGQPHTDALSGNPIKVKNVVVIRMPTSKRGRYAVMETIGNGKAITFKNGKAIKGTWQQKSYNDRIEIHNKKGKQIPLNRGDTWFAILPSGKTLSY